MKAEDTEFAQGFIRMCSDGYAQGWHEKNGGNLSYLLKPEDMESVRDQFHPLAWKQIGTEVKELAGQYFMVTGSGKYMRNVELNPAANTCIIEVSADGQQYRIVWGLVKGGRPTSELPTHLMNLEVCRRRNKDIRVIYHCHPANTIALTYVLPLESEVFTRELYEMATECPIVFPEGIGVVPWMVPGGRDIAVATSKLMEKQDVVVWAHHGMFCCGRDFDEAFGLMHTVEKAAEVLVKVKSMTDVKRQTITSEQFHELEKPFNVKINERFLYERSTNRIGEK